MNKGKALLVRACPVCRVAMVRTDTGWSCAQCGSAIVDVPVKIEQREPTREAAPATD
jgi:uncharacterized Zn finger protein (UPF0148 family)